jgi:hypothetical protein
LKAFPNGIITNKDGLIVGGHQGMDLLDWFAGLAMQSMNSRPDYEDESAEVIALDAYALADEMMKVRKL